MEKAMITAEYALEITQDSTNAWKRLTYPQIEEEIIQASQNCLTKVRVNGFISDEIVKELTNLGFTVKQESSYPIRHPNNGKPVLVPDWLIKW